MSNKSNAARHCLPLFTWLQYHKVPTWLIAAAANNARLHNYLLVMNQSGDYEDRTKILGEAGQFLNGQVDLLTAEILKLHQNATPTIVYAQAGDYTEARRH